MIPLVLWNGGFLLSPWQDLRIKNKEIKTRACQGWDNAKSDLKNIDAIVPVIIACKNFDYPNLNQKFLTNFSNFLITTTKSLSENHDNVQVTVDNYVKALEQIIDITEINEKILAKESISDLNKLEIFANNIDNLREAIDILNKISWKKFTDSYQFTAQKTISDVSTMNIRDSINQIVIVLQYLFSETSNNQNQELLKKLNERKIEIEKLLKDLSLKETAQKNLKEKLKEAFKYIKTVLQYPGIYSDDLIDSTITSLYLNTYKISTENENELDLNLETIIENLGKKNIFELKSLISQISKFITLINNDSENTDFLIFWKNNQKKTDTKFLLEKLLKSTNSKLLEESSITTLFNEDDKSISEQINFYKALFEDSDLNSWTILTQEKRNKIVRLNDVLSSTVTEIFDSKINNIFNASSQISITFKKIKELIDQNNEFWTESEEDNDNDNLESSKKIYDILTTYFDEKEEISPPYNNFKIYLETLNNDNFNLLSEIENWNNNEIKQKITTNQKEFFQDLKNKALKKINDAILTVEENLKTAETKLESLFNLSFDENIETNSDIDSFSEEMISKKSEATTLKTNIETVITDLKTIKTNIDNVNYESNDWNKDFDSDFLIKDGDNIITTKKTLVNTKMSEITKIYDYLLEEKNKVLAKLYGFDKAKLISQIDNLINGNDEEFNNIQSKIDILNKFLSLMSELNENDYSDLTAINEIKSSIERKKNEINAILKTKLPNKKTEVTDQEFDINNSEGRFEFGDFIEESTNELASKFTFIDTEFTKTNVLFFNVQKQIIVNKLIKTKEAATAAKKLAKEKIQKINDWENAADSLISKQFNAQKKIIKTKKTALNEILNNDDPLVDDLASLQNELTNINYNSESTSEDIFTSFDEKIATFTTNIKIIISEINSAFQNAETISADEFNLIKEIIIEKIKDFVEFYNDELLKINKFDEIKTKILALDSENLITNFDLDQKTIDIEQVKTKLNDLLTTIAEMFEDQDSAIIEIKAELTKATEIKEDNPELLNDNKISENLSLAKWIYFNIKKATALTKINEEILLADDQLYIADKLIADFIDLSWILNDLLVVNDDKREALKNKIKKAIAVFDEIEIIINDEFNAKQQSITETIFDIENQDIETQFSVDEFLTNKKTSIEIKIKKIKNIYKNTVRLLKSSYSEEFTLEKTEFLQIINYLLDKTGNEWTDKGGKERKIIESISSLTSETFTDILPVTKEQHRTIAEQQKQIIIIEWNKIKELSFDEETRSELDNFKTKINELNFDSDTPRQFFIDKLNIYFDGTSKPYSLQRMITSWTKINIFYQRFTQSRKVMIQSYLDREMNKKIIEIQEKIESNEINQKLIEAEKIVAKITFWFEIIKVLKISNEIPTNWTTNVEKIITKINKIKKLIKNNLVSVIGDHSHFPNNYWTNDFDSLNLTFWAAIKTKYEDIFSKIQTSWTNFQNLYKIHENSQNNIETIITNKIINGSFNENNESHFNAIQKTFFETTNLAINNLIAIKKDNQISDKLLEIKEYLDNYHWNSDYENISNNFFEKIEEIQKTMLIFNNQIDQKNANFYFMLGISAIIKNPETQPSYLTNDEDTTNHEDFLDINNFIAQYNNFLIEQKKWKRLKFLLNVFDSSLIIDLDKKKILNSRLSEEDLTVDAAIDILKNIFFRATSVPGDLSKVELNWNFYEHDPDVRYKILFWEDLVKKEYAKFSEFTRLKTKKSNLPYLFNNISITNNKGKAIIEGLAIRRWYTFAIKEFTDNTNEFNIYNFGSVYIHNGIKVGIMEFNEDGTTDQEKINHAFQIESIFANDAISAENWADMFNPIRLNELFFPLDTKETTLVVSNSYLFDSESITDVDILSMSYQYYSRSDATEKFASFKNKYTFYSQAAPLIVVAGGNQDEASCSVDAWSYSKNHRLDVEDSSFYKACNLFVANIIKTESSYADHLIIVGSSDETNGNRPGEVLQDHWISTHFTWDLAGTKLLGTNFGTAYVAKIAAEIKRRAPNYNNSQIADLIFDTAYDAGEPGTDAIYGRGILNPLAIFAELSRRGF